MPSKGISFDLTHKQGERSFLIFSLDKITNKLKRTFLKNIKSKMTDNQKVQNYPKYEKWCFDWGCCISVRNQYFRVAKGTRTFG